MSDETEIEPEAPEDIREEHQEDIPELEDEAPEEPEAESEDPEAKGEAQKAEPEAQIVVDLDQVDEEETSTIRHVRKEFREQQQRVKELEAQLAQQQPAKTELGPKPKLADYSYDPAQFEAALLSWNEQKRQVDEAARAAQEREAEQDAAYQKKLAAYQAGREKLGVKQDVYDEAEKSVRAALPADVQSVIVAHAKDPALAVYALGRDPALLAELEGAQDIVEAAYRLGTMDGRNGMTAKKKPRVAPERRIKGKTTAPRDEARTLEAARAEARKTGDFSHVLALKRAQQ